jgi:hypothetical protein
MELINMGDSPIVFNYDEWELAGSRMLGAECTGPQEPIAPQGHAFILCSIDQMIELAIDDRVKGDLTIAYTPIGGAYPRTVHGSFQARFTGEENNGNVVSDSSFETSTVRWTAVSMTGTRVNMSIVNASGGYESDAFNGWYAVKATFFSVPGAAWRRPLTGLVPGMSYRMRAAVRSTEPGCDLVFTYDRVGGAQVSIAEQLENTYDEWDTDYRVFTLSSDATGTGYLDAPRCDGNQVVYIDNVRVEPLPLSPVFA